MRTITLRIPSVVHALITDAAARDRVSMNCWLSNLVRRELELAAMPGDSVAFDYIDVDVAVPLVVIGSDGRPEFERHMPLPDFQRLMAAKAARDRGRNLKQEGKSDGDG